MHKILVIEPHQILRHAFAVALSPDYRVETVATFPDVQAGKEPDLIVVDAAALRERGWLGAPDRSAIEKWQKPVIWIDGIQSGQPESATHVCLKWPVERDVLKKAVAGLLQKVEQTGKKILKPSTVSSSERVGEGQPAEENPPSVTTGTDKKLIELIDIVE